MANERIGRYIIKSELGRGGMATVYHAYDPSFERDVAIKVLPAAFLHDPQFRTRFEREAKMIAQLEHPAIVPVHDFGEQDGQPYIVMRYMGGGSLADRLSHGAMSFEETTGIISRLAPALDAAHVRGIIHRDIKPGNVLFDQYGNAFLSDFGIARLTQQTATTLTGESIVGTPAYMSPEQVQANKTIDGRSDIYSLGVVIFQMLTGQVPYQAETPTQVMVMHILEPVPDLLEKRPDLPPGSQEIIRRAMAKEPTDRFSTTAELASAMEAALKGKFVSATSLEETLFVQPERPDLAHIPADQPKGRSFPLSLVLSLVIVALLILGGVVGGIIFRSCQGGPQALLTPSLIVPPPGITPSATTTFTPPVITPSVTHMPAIITPPTATDTPAPGILMPDSVTASGYTDPGQDSKGNTTTFNPENVLDGDSTTAWRVSGDGAGEWLQFNFDSPVVLQKIGIIPGYAKIDPYDGTDRFEQNYVVETIGLEFSDGSNTTHTFDYNRDMQFMELESVKTTFVRIVILDTYPPRSENPRKYTPISEVELYGWAQ